MSRNASYPTEEKIENKMKRNRDFFFFLESFTDKKMETKYVFLSLSSYPSCWYVYMCR